MTPAEEATIIDLADPLTWPITHVLCDAHEEEVEEKSMATGPAVASRDNTPEVFPRSQPCRQQACLPFGTATRQSGSQAASQPATELASQLASWEVHLSSGVCTSSLPIAAPWSPYELRAC